MNYGSFPLYSKLTQLDLHILFLYEFWQGAE